MAVTKCDKIAATYSIGGDTTERMCRTALLYVCRSELSFNSDMRRISGLQKFRYAVESMDQTVGGTYSIGTAYGKIIDT